MDNSNDVIRTTAWQVRRLAAWVFPNYHENQFSIEFTKQLSYRPVEYAGHGCYYAAVGASEPNKPRPDFAPWRHAEPGAMLELPSDIVVVERRFHYGIDDGIRLYIHPVHRQKWLEKIA